MSALALVVLVMLLPVGHGQWGQASPSDCGAVREWVDYLNGMIDRHHDLAQREVALASSTIEARGSRLLDALLNSCGT